MNKTLSILTNVTGGAGLAYGLADITSLIGQVAALISGIALVLNLILNIINKVKNADKDKNGHISKQELLDLIDSLEDEIKQAENEFNKTNNKEGD